MNIYVIRHGQVSSNKERIIASYTEVDLDETGIEQAMQASRLLKEIDYDMIYCSPQKRTMTTMKILNKDKKPVIFDERLKERNAGKLEGKSALEIDLDSYWNYYNEDIYENAESMMSLFQRVYEFLEYLKKQSHLQNVVIVTHDGVCRTIACYFRGIPKDGNIRVYKHKNCEIRKYELK